MFKNYLKIAVRYLWKNKFYSLINIFGLGVAIAISITGYINYQYSESFDNFHIDKDHIHLLNTFNDSRDR
jgi:putative ABC transport system permease protein